MRNEPQPRVMTSFQFPSSSCIPRLKRCNFYLETAFEFGTRLVHGLVTLQQLDDEDGEMLVRARAHGDGHRADAGGASQVDLKLFLMYKKTKKATLRPLAPMVKPIFTNRLMHPLGLVCGCLRVLFSKQSQMSRVQTWRRFPHGIHFV